MKQVYKIDSDGFYVEPVIIEESEFGSDLILIAPPQLYKAKWEGAKWIEGATQKYIDSLNQDIVSMPALRERVDFLEETLLMLI